MIDDAWVQRVYEAYSSQDLDGLLAFLAEDVDWPDGARRLHGKDEVAAYWRKQWSAILTTDTPAVVAALSDDVWVVRIDQTVRTTGGDAVSNGTFAHVLHLDGALLARLDIVPL